MKAEEILARYERHTGKWLEELDTFPAGQLHVSVNGGWSMAQVIDHISKTTETCVGLAVQCAERKGETGRPGFGPAVFGLMGGFPPVKIRVRNPPPRARHLYHPENVSAGEARQALEQASEAMRMALQQVRSADPKVRIEHWAGGWFNSLQWYRNAEMHIRHHFRQLKRLKRAIDQASPHRSAH